MGMVSFTGAEMDDRNYESWVTTLAEASARLDTLQAAVTELQRLCRSQDVRSEQVLEVLVKHGAITKAAGRRFAAA